MYESWSNLPKELTNGIKDLVGLFQELLSYETNS